MRDNKAEQLKLYFYILSIIHLCSVIVGMTLTSRMVEIDLSLFNYKLNTTGGVFLIPAAFLIQDIITEIYGYSNAKKVLISSLFIFTLYIFSWYVMTWIPCEREDKYCAMLNIIGLSLPRHAFSFVVSLAVGGTLNNYILNKLKLMFNGRFLAIRFISATAIGELIFQLIAVAISWAGMYSIWEIMPLAIISYLYKILFEILSTPLNVLICKYLKSLQINDNYVIHEL